MNTLNPITKDFVDEISLTFIQCDHYFNYSDEFFKIWKFSKNREVKTFVVEIDPDIEVIREWMSKNLRG